MRNIRCNEMGDTPLPLELCSKHVCVSRGGVKPEITAGKTHYSHPDRQRQTKHVKWTAVDNPDAVGDRLEDIKRRVGATFVSLVRHFAAPTSQRI
jgi:hypothetical protein